jgi:hypothetical protein
VKRPPRAPPVEESQRLTYSVAPPQQSNTTSAQPLEARGLKGLRPLDSENAVVHMHHPLAAPGSRWSAAKPEGVGRSRHGNRSSDTTGFSHGGKNSSHLRMSWSVGDSTL